MIDTEVRKVPAEALRFSLGPCEFGVPKADSGNVPVKIVARTGQPVEHWYWGTVVHDLAGMKLHKPTLPIDYAHYDAEVLGFLNHFDTESGDLIARGELTPFIPDDRASEVINKASRGVPYEASIFFTDPVRLEDVQKGAAADVNGYTLEGPATIIREWSLRGVAVCPYGLDRNTTTQFKHLGDVPITIERKGLMSDSPQPDAVDQRAQLKRYIEAFGVEKGTEWHLAEKSYVECLQAHVEDLRAASEQQAEAITKLTTERDELKDQITKLSADKEGLTDQVAKLTGEVKRFKQAVDRGEEVPTEFQADDDSPEGQRTAQLKQRLGDNLGGIAAGLRFKN